MAFFTAFKSILVKALTSIATKELIDALKTIPTKAKSWWQGKKVAAIGPTAAGKNSFYQRLQRESIPVSHHRTRGADEVKSFNFRQTLPEGGELEFECKRSINVGGEADERDRYWLQACEDAEVIFYIIDVEHLSSENYSKGGRIYDDLKWLATHLGQLHPNALVHILVNKIDTLLIKFDSQQKIEIHLEPHINSLEISAKELFGPYAKRLTGVTPISMQDDHIFNTSFAATLQAVHSSLG